MILGAIIGGDVTVSAHPAYYAMSPVVDCSGFKGPVILSFQRWLNSDYNPYMNNLVEVYKSGTWQVVWQSGVTPINESSWSAQSCDVTFWATNNPAFQVRFGHQTGTGAWAYSGWNIDDVTIAGIPLSPIAPVFHSVQAVSCNRMDLRWRNLCNETSFTLFRNTLNDFSGSSKISGTSVNVTNWSDTGLAASTKYFYWLKAYNLAGSSGLSAVVSNSTLPPPPPTPTLHSVDPLGTNSFRVFWQPIASATSYTLYKASGQGTNGLRACAGTLPGITNIVVAGVGRNAWSFYRIEAFTATVGSGWSSVISNLPLPTAPEFRPAVASESALAISWRKIPNATAYTLYRSEGSDISAAIAIAVIQAPTTNFLDAAVIPMTNYHYVLRAVNVSGVSARSGILSVLFLPQVAQYVKAGVYPTVFDFSASSGVRIYCGEGSGQVRVRVYDIGGHLFKDFGSKSRDEMILWDGTGDSGRDPEAGVYFLQVSGDGKRDIVKFIIVK